VQSKSSDDGRVIGAGDQFSSGHEAVVKQKHSGDHKTGMTRHCNLATVTLNCQSPCGSEPHQHDPTTFCLV
jgi:hypothetical protein